MVVYLVIHDSGDYESSIEIRGVFATSELAEQVVTLDETGVYPANRSQGERIWRRGHDANCCAVEEMTVETALPQPFVLNPERPYRAGTFLPLIRRFEAIEKLHNLHHPAPTARK